MALKCRMRLYERQQWQGFNLHGISQGILMSKAKLLHITLAGTSTAGSEIDALTAKLQLSTAAIMEMDSSQANDKNAADGHVRSVNTIGVNENNEPLNRTEEMHATNGTTIKDTTNLYMDLWHTHSNLWGSGDKDAAGTVDISKGDATLIGRITASANEGQGSGFKVPIGWRAALISRTLQAIGSQGAAEGKFIKLLYVDENDFLNDVRAFNYEIIEIFGTVRRVEGHSVMVFDEKTEITFFQGWSNAGGEDFEAHYYFLLWKVK